MTIKTPPGARIEAVTYNLLGLTIRVRSICQRTLLQVHQYFYAHLVSNDCFPDLFFDLTQTLENDRLRFLFRSQRRDMEYKHLGVKYLMPGCTWRNWTNLEGPLIPLVQNFVESRFVGLHGAGVVSPNNGAALFLGHKGSGKTTLTRAIMEDYGWEVLSDENICVESDSLLVHPLLRPMHLGILGTHGEVRKIKVPFDKVVNFKRARPSRPDSIFLLSNLPGLSAARLVEIRDTKQIVAAMLPHCLDFGATVHLVSKTIVTLALTCRAFHLLHGGYTSLVDTLPSIVELANA